MRRVAAIDCGTNSIRLLVADIVDGRLVEVFREMRIVRLGEGVDETGVLRPAAIGRALAALADYADTMDRLGCESSRMVATSAVRDASNAAEFVAGCVSLIGSRPDVLTGEEEAALSFRGATADIADVTDLAGPYLVVDIGGGSTEFVFGTSSVEAARSVDIGCVRLTERRLRTDPPTPDEITLAEGDVDAMLAQVESVVDARRAATMIGLAGSVTTVAALSLGLPAYDPVRIHLARISRDQVESVTARLLAMTHEERAALPAMHPGRIDVIGGGALILRSVVRRFDFACVVASEHDILDGIARSLA